MPPSRSRPARSGPTSNSASQRWIRSAGTGCGLAPRIKTAPLQTTANNIYAIVKGSGATMVDGERFEWKRGDVIAAPAWRPHFHEAAEDALLLRVTDEPVMQRLGFHRVEEQASATH